MSGQILAGPMRSFAILAAFLTLAPFIPTAAAVAGCSFYEPDWNAGGGVVSQGFDYQGVGRIDGDAYFAITAPPTISWSLFSASGSPILRGTGSGASIGPMGADVCLNIYGTGAYAWYLGELPL